MQIKEMFAKPIDREIQGVIIVGQGEEAGVLQELEEYVVTRELQKHFADFFEAYITKSGWDYLIQRYGYEGLYHIDQKSGWFNAENLEEFKQCVDAEVEYCIVAGLNA